MASIKAPKFQVVFEASGSAGIAVLNDLLGKSVAVWMISRFETEWVLCASVSCDVKIDECNCQTEAILLVDSVIITQKESEWIASQISAKKLMDASDIKVLFSFQKNLHSTRRIESSDTSMKH